MMPWSGLPRLAGEGVKSLQKIKMLGFPSKLPVPHPRGDNPGVLYPGLRRSRFKTPRASLRHARRYRSSLRDGTHINYVSCISFITTSASAQRPCSTSYPPLSTKAMSESSSPTTSTIRSILFTRRRRRCVQQTSTPSSAEAGYRSGPQCCHCGCRGTHTTICPFYNPATCT
ncbi:hypothetical protein C8F01DRAFT_1142002, partial [Mycena amicta]